MVRLAFTLDKRARLVGQAKADSEEKLLAFFESVATGPWKIHYWPPGGHSGERRMAVIEPSSRG